MPSLVLQPLATKNNVLLNCSAHPTQYRNELRTQLVSRNVHMCKRAASLLTSCRGACADICSHPTYLLPSTVSTADCMQIPHPSSDQHRCRPHPQNCSWHCTRIEASRHATIQATTRLGCHAAVPCCASLHTHQRTPHLHAVVRWNMYMDSSKSQNLLSKPGDQVIR